MFERRKFRFGVGKKKDFGGRKGFAPQADVTINCEIMVFVNYFKYLDSCLKVEAKVRKRSWK